MGASPTYIRPAGPGDTAIIRDTWLRSFRHSYHVRGIESEVYAHEHRKIMDLVLTRPSATTLVLCERADPTFVFGWICGEIINNWLVVHFLYVKGPYQDYGSGTALVKEFLDNEPGIRGIVYTHQTKAGRKWAEKMEERLPERDLGDGSPPQRLPLIYNPYLLYKTMGPRWH